MSDKIALTREKKMDLNTVTRIRRAIKNEPDEVRAAFELACGGGFCSGIENNPWPAEDGGIQRQAEMYLYLCETDLDKDVFEAYLRVKHPELLRPEVKIPTEDGLYTIAENNVGATDRRIYRRCAGVWSEVTGSASPQDPTETEEWEEFIETGEWKLRRLIIDPKEIDND